MPNPVHIGFGPAVGLITMMQTLTIYIRGGVAGGAGGAAAPPGFWMGSKKILGKTTKFGEKNCCAIARQFLQ